MDWESARFSKHAPARPERTTKPLELGLAAVILCSLVAMLMLGSGCSSMSKSLGIGGEGGEGKPIGNPWGDQAWTDKQSRDRVIFRSRKGSRALEVELPADQPGVDDFQIPMSPEFAAASTEGGRNPASAGGGGGGSFDPTYEERSPTQTDMEITMHMPAGNPADDKERQDIEQGLGLKPVEDDAPKADKSYLGSVDKIKQLFRNGRYEAGLLEVDQMLRLYPTDPKLYEMRGTLLDRLGHHDLALRSWQQALKLEPTNESLKIYIDRKSETANWRKAASE